MSEAERLPRMRWLRRALWGGAGLLAALAFLAVAVPPLLPEGLVGRIVARRLGAALGREAAVAGARFSLFSGLRARGIAVRERAGFGGVDFLRIARLTATPRALFVSPRHLASVEIEGAELRLVRDERGELNVQDLTAKSLPKVHCERLRISNVRVTYCDLERGGSASILITSGELGPAARGKRPVRLGARLPDGGVAMLMGELWLTPGDGAPEGAQAHLLVRSLALGPLAAGLQPGRLLPPALAGAALDADFELDGRAERLLRGKGTLRLMGLPEVPQLGLAGPSRAIAATISGELSSFMPHFELEVVTQPDEAARLTASLRQIVADGSVPSFSMDNYRLTLKAGARADFAQGGLPGTPLAAGRGSLHVSLDGTMAEANVAVRAALADGAVAVGDKAEPLPPMSLQLDGTFSLAGLSATLSRFVASTEGVNVTASGEARPAKGGEVRIGHDGSLPPMKGRWKAEVAADLAKWPLGLRALAGLPADQPTEASFGANARADLAGEGKYELDVSARGVALDHDSPWTARLPILSIVSAVAGGRPAAMEFVASLDARFKAAGTSPRAIKASFAGDGRLTLSRLRIVDPPLLRLLTLWPRRQVPRELVFDRVDAPFALAAGRVDATATTPYGGGELLFRGHSTAETGLHYALYVREPRKVAFIPSELASYLEAGLPLMHVTGPPEAPVARIPIEAILKFNLLP